ncbi:MAG: type IV conjugative transfer system protein TraL [Pseudomonadota bacterium]
MTASEEVQLSRSINKEAKYSGLSLFGLILGGIFGAVTLVKFDLVFALFAGVIGFVIGAFISSSWHKGRVQRWIYWHLPISEISGNKYLPPSHLRTFM